VQFLQIKAGLLTGITGYDIVDVSTIDVATIFNSINRSAGNMADTNQIYTLLKDVFFLLDDGDRRLFGSYNLSVSRFYILWHLGNEPGISSRRLSELMLHDKSNITRLTQGLEADGLISRLPDENDGRALRLFLTEVGESVRQQALAAHLAYNQHRFEFYSDDQQKTVSQQLRELKQNLMIQLQNEPPQMAQ
jgi:DNA-binding MarR family transcriptional regulator